MARADEIYVEDLKSKNGVFLNGVKILRQKIYLDDVEFYTLANNANLPFNADFFLILNVAMGGTLGGNVDAAFTEATVEIDYIKVYQ